MWADPTTTRALNGLKIFLERAASVPSLNRFLTAVQVLDIVLVPIDALCGNPNKTVMREWYSALGGDWLDRALADPSFASSRVGQVRAEFLYDEVRLIVERSLSDLDSQWIEHLRTLIGEVDAFAVGLQTDGTTQRLVGALSNLATTLKDATATTLWTASEIARNHAERAKREALEGFIL